MENKNDEVKEAREKILKNLKELRKEMMGQYSKTTSMEIYSYLEEEEFELFFNMTSTMGETIHRITNLKLKMED